MGCLFRTIGIISIILAVGVILFWMIDTSPSNSTIERLFCNDSEELVRGSETVRSSDNTETNSITFHCKDTSGAQREVTGSVVLATIVTFIFPLFTGIAALFYSAQFGRHRQQMPVNVHTNFIDLGTMSGSVEIIGDIPTSKAEIDEKLAKLQTLVQKGMLTQEQYNEIERQLRSNQQF